MGGFAGTAHLENNWLAIPISDAHGREPFTDHMKELEHPGMWVFHLSQETDEMPHASPELFLKHVLNQITKIVLVFLRTVFIIGDSPLDKFNPEGGALESLNSELVNPGKW